MSIIIPTMPTWLWVAEPNIDERRHNERCAALLTAMPLIGQTFDGVFYCGPDRTRDHSVAVLKALKATVKPVALARRLWNDLTPTGRDAPFREAWYRDIIGVIRQEAKAWGFAESWIETENYKVNGGALEFETLTDAEFGRMALAVCQASRIERLFWGLHPLASHPNWYTHALVGLGRRILQCHGYTTDPTVSPLKFPFGREAKCHAWAAYVTSKPSQYDDRPTWQPEEFVARFRGGVAARIMRDHRECKRIVVYAEAHELTEVVTRIAKAAGVT